MVLQRWYPIAELRRAERAVNRFRRGYGERYSADGATQDWLVPLDVVEEDDQIIVHASVPGVAPEDIEVTIENEVLTIKAQSAEEEERKDGDYLVRERRSGAFHRSLRLPDTVDTEKAESSYKGGVLTISFPKQEAKKAKVIEVKAA